MTVNRVSSPAEKARAPALALLCFLVAHVITTTLAEDLRADGLPSTCTTIYQPIVDLTPTREIDHNEVDTDNDKRRQLRLRESEDCVEAIEAHCICTNRNSDVAAVMGPCVSCMAQNSQTTDGTNCRECTSDDG
ncbi:hypothetical protein AUP68_09871 [Ilyonectria robusta]